MEVEIITALSQFGGMIVGILVSSRLTQYRLKELEKKMDKHNNFIERITRLEGTSLNTCQDVTEIKGALKELRDEILRELKEVTNR